MAAMLLQQFFSTAASFLVFRILDWIDQLLCISFHFLDLLLDSTPSPCYCDRGPKSTLLDPESNLRPTSESLQLASATTNAYHPYSLSDTLYEREHVQGNRLLRRVGNAIHLSGVAVEQKQIVPGRNYLELETTTAVHTRETASNVLQRFWVTTRDGHALNVFKRICFPFPGRGAATESLQTGNFTADLKPRLKWSDCGCATCRSWHSGEKDKLYVTVGGQGLTDSNYCKNEDAAQNNVIFIHGFLSSSSFWTESVFPHLSKSTKSSCRLFAIDLLGFGKSPKPTTCFYTIADQLEKIRDSLLLPYKVDSFHLVAHSMGCIIALALAASYADVVKSVVLISPPYYSAPPNERAGPYVLRQVAPRRIWPPIMFGTSVMSWYEHLGRMVCLIVCKNHRVWESLLRLVTLNRIRTFLVQDFMQHTHHSAWHIFHNVICGGAYALDGYLSILEKTDCDFTIFHGVKDTVCPVKCSIDLHKRLPKTFLKIVDEANHISVIVGREKAFAEELESIWQKHAASS